jgi:hypothetical protein
MTKQYLLGNPNLSRVDMDQVTLSCVRGNWTAGLGTIEGYRYKRSSTSGEILERYLFSLSTRGLCASQNFNDGQYSERTKRKESLL